MKLEIKDLEFAYDSKPVLKSVNLGVESGEILGLIGPNAAGKTTLLKCINRILEPQEGSVLLEGEKLTELGKEEIAKKAGYVPQAEEGGFPSKVFDTILMGRHPHSGWKPSSADIEKVSKIIDMLELGRVAMREIEELSQGQKQKVMIARALAQEPEILLLDEPTNNLDLKHQLEIMDVVKKYTKNGTSTVMAIHDLNLASRYSDKLVMLKNGKIFAAGSQEILNPRNLKSVYGVKARIERNNGERRIVPEKPL